MQTASSHSQRRREKSKAKQEKGQRITDEVSQYSSTNAYAFTSALARILTTVWTGSLTTITLMYKQELGVVAENLNSTQMAALLSKNCNVFVAYDNDTVIIQPGICPSGQFIDTVIGADWLAYHVQTQVYNLLFTTATKIPQTDRGSNQIANVIESCLTDARTNGYLAPGQWNASGFGQLNPGDFLSKGFYVYYPPVASQAESVRAERISVPFQCACKLAGAVHTVDVSLIINP